MSSVSAEEFQKLMLSARKEINESLKHCNIKVVDGDDNAFAMLNDGGPCFSASQAGPSNGEVFVELLNNCAFAHSVGKAANIAVLVYD